MFRAGQDGLMLKVIIDTLGNCICSLPLWQSSETMLQEKKSHILHAFINCFLRLKYLIRRAKNLQLKLSSVRTISFIMPNTK